MLPWPYELVRSPRRRRLAIQVTPAGALRVAAPVRLEVAAIEQWLLRAQPWIETQLARVKTRLAEQPPRRFEPGERFYWLGREYELQFGPTPRREVRLIGGVLVVPAESPAEARAQLTRFYRREAQRILAEKTLTLAAGHQLTVEHVGITRAVGRWGSCSRRCRINYSWRLLQCPEPAIDYVVAHELAHCVEMNHSPRFYAVVEQFYPAWQEWREFLKREGWRYGGW